ncbi:MAG: phosphate ABC transporter permease subunit PstC [Nitrososphaera sp.]|jgi:phosphate ABC transporter phosphate-binding protein/phosphate ABC transporter permease protein PstC/phosphate ABC transporter permease subunit PstA
MAVIMSRLLYYKFLPAAFLAGMLLIFHGIYPLQPALAQKTVITINGAGATFPFPLIDTWRNEYQKIDPAVNINYQSIGSGGGVKQFTEKTVDFGASDAPLSASERKNAPNAVHIPETIGSIVVSYNLPSIPQKGLKLSGPVLADIFLGKIRKWNDPSIVSLNPGADLPAASILVVHRSDGSGTTFVWTDYLSKVSSEWQQKVGVGKSVEWPNGVGAPGNEGVANAIKGTAYSMGYIELSYVQSTKMPYAFLQNKEGNFVEPSFDSIKAAISSSISSLPKGEDSWSNVSVTNAAGKDSYPIASFSYLLLYKELGDNPSIDKEKAKTIFEFILWAITDGQQYAARLGYVPLPDEVVKINKETLQSFTFHGQSLSSIISSSSSPSNSAVATLHDGLPNNNNYLMLLAAVGIAAGGAIALQRIKTRKQILAAAFPESVGPRQPSEEKPSAGKTQNLVRKKAISSTLSRKGLFWDRAFRAIVLGAAGYTVFLMILVAYSAFTGSAEAFSKEGVIGFITGTDWNAVEGRESYGALPYIIGTLASAGIAMAIGVPIGIGIALFISEISPRRIATPLSFVVELLAAVPSIIYGLWALFVFRFWVRDIIEMPLHQALGDYLFAFAKAPFGLDIFTAGIVLAIMIIPTVSSIAREVMRAVPNSQREAAYSLGATKWEAVRTAVFPSAKSGLFGASILGLGRAVGETMLVTMVIGNAIGLAAIPTSPFSPSQTLASLIANEFNEAVTSFQTSALIALGAVLFLVTIAINIGARLMVSRITKPAGMGRKLDRGEGKPSLRSSGSGAPKEEKKYSILSSSFESRLHPGGKDNVNIVQRRAQVQQTIRGLLRANSSRRNIVNIAITLGAFLCIVAAIIPLGSILLEVIKNGAAALSFEFLTQPPGSLGSGEGGIGPAIQGTLIVVGLASAIGAPIGVMAGIYQSEYAGAQGKSSRFAYSIRFFNDILTGLPSIVIGIVGYVTIVLATGSFSVWAGAFALSIILIPVVVRVTEETLKIVPNGIREAAHSLGIPRWKVALFIVLPTAKSGIVTGIVLAVSRIMGETAPLIMTILGTSLFFTSFTGPVDALPLRIWRLASQPYESAHSFGWGAALILILIVLVLSVGLRFVSRGRGEAVP